MRGSGRAIAGESMPNHRILLASVALVWAGPAFAQSEAEVLAQQAQEIRELKAQVQALTARLDAQEVTMRGSREQAAPPAPAPVTQAAAASAPVEGKPAVAAAANPAPQWYDSTSVSGRVFFDFSHIDQDSNGVPTANSGTGFNVKRLYLSVDHKFDDVFSADLTTDADNVVGSTSKQNFAPGTANLIGKGLFIKKAYLQAKLDPALTIRLGSADMPWITYVEGLYGYRHIENTLIDRTSFGNSADWGIHVLGELAHGLVSYQVSVVDGAGYRNVKVTNAVDVAGRVSLAYKGFFGAVGGYSGKLGNDVEGTPTFRTATRLDLLAGYKNRLFTLGGEYFRARNWTNNGQNYILSPALTDKAEGYSLFGSVNFAPKLSAFGRYDWVKPREDAVPALVERYFNVGVQYSPLKLIDLALVYKRDRAANGTIATSNGTIGGSIDGTYDEFGLFGQFRF